MIIESIRDWIESKLLSTYTTRRIYDCIYIRTNEYYFIGVIYFNKIYTNTDREICLDVNDPEMFSKLEKFLVKIKAIKES